MGMRNLAMIVLSLGGVLMAVTAWMKSNISVQFPQKESSMSFFETLKNFVSPFLPFAGKICPISLDKPLEEFTQQDVAAVLRLAGSGNADAQFLAGRIYASGTYVSVDRVRAIEWWRKAADGGNAEAQDTMGGVYSDGEDVPVDDKKAFHYFTKAVAQGNVYALNNLGVMYESGRYVEQNFQKAFEYFKKAADGGLLYAQMAVADMYLYGRGVSSDLSKACQIYKKVLKNKEDLSEENVMHIYENLGEIYNFHKVSDRDLTQEEAISYLQEAYKLGGMNSRALIFVSFIAAEEKESGDAALWIQRTFYQNPNDPRVLFAMGMLYEFGVQVPKDYETAFSYYKKSAELGEPWGMHYLAYAYGKGQGTAPDLKKGFQWELKAAETLPQAQFNVAQQYLFGMGVDVDRDKALFWFTKASSNLYRTADEYIRYYFIENDEGDNE